MSANNSNKHLTLDERKIIQTGIGNGSTQASIGEILGKDRSTIGREIKEHRYRRNVYTLPAECAIYAQCKPGNGCTGIHCPRYVPFKCTRRDRSPGACNGCEKYSKCRFNKYIYDAVQAQNEYQRTLVDSRCGENLTTQ